MKITIKMPEEPTHESRQATNSASILGSKAVKPSISYIKFTQPDVHKIGTDIHSLVSAAEGAAVVNFTNDRENLTYRHC
jgi:hypothetical protein